MKRGPGRPRKYFTEAERLAADAARKERYRRAHPRPRAGKRGRPRKYSTPEELEAARRAARRRHYLKANPNARSWPLVDERRRAWDLREEGYTHEEIANVLDVGASTVHGWLRSTGIARKLRPKDREPIATALRSGESPESIAARFGYGERSIHEWIREGRLPKKADVEVACSACGSMFAARQRNRLGAACSDRCRRALANASKVCTRWRARGRRISSTARALITAQALLRIETTEGIGD